MRTAKKWLLLAIVLSPSLVFAREARSAVVLKQATEAQVSKAQIEAICRELPKPCLPKSTLAFVPAKGHLGSVFLIDSSWPMLVQRDVHSGKEPKVLYWDFSTYKHSVELQQDSSDRISLYPVLYPVGTEGFAVALLNNWNEGYSGGGAGFEVADFLALEKVKGKSGGFKYWPFYTSIPFSCSKLIRACFTERDYRKRKRCHDEYAGHLTIQYPEIQQEGWKFTWTDMKWPSTESRKTARKINFEAPAKSDENALEKLIQRISFCDGWSR